LGSFCVIVKDGSTNISANHKSELSPFFGEQKRIAFFSSYFLKFDETLLSQKSTQIFVLLSASAGQ
jgi:hypothetical protein